MENLHNNYSAFSVKLYDETIREKRRKKGLTFSGLAGIIKKLSNDRPTTESAVMAQVVEHVLGKDEVTSSNLVNSSKTPAFQMERGCFLLPKRSLSLPRGKGRPFSFYPRNPRSSSHSAASSAQRAV